MFCFLCARCIAPQMWSASAMTRVGCLSACSFSPVRFMASVTSLMISGGSRHLLRHVVGILAIDGDEPTDDLRVIHMLSRLGLEAIPRPVRITSRSPSLANTTLLLNTRRTSTSTPFSPLCDRLALDVDHLVPCLDVDAGLRRDGGEGGGVEHRHQRGGAVSSALHLAKSTETSGSPASRAHRP